MAVLILLYDQYDFFLYKLESERDKVFYQHYAQCYAYRSVPLNLIIVCLFVCLFSKTGCVWISTSVE